MSEPTLNRMRLIACREKLSITKQEAAKRMHMSQPAYLRYESGSRSPSIHVIQTMADVLGTSAEYLTGETDIEAPNSYLITESAEPELFRMIDIYKNTDAEMQKRMKEYFRKLSNSRNEQK